MKQVLAVYEGDQGYARGLTGYLTVRHRVPFQVVTLTKEEMVVHMAASGKIDVLLAQPASCGYGLNLQDGGHHVVWFGLTWAKHSRLKRADGKEPPYMGEDKEFLVLYTKEYLKSHPNIDYFIYGHRHIELDLMLSRKARMMIIGDWIWQFTYVVFDGKHIFLEEYVEGESQL